MHSPKTFYLCFSQTCTVFSGVVSPQLQVLVVDVRSVLELLLITAIETNLMRVMMKGDDEKKLNSLLFTLFSSQTNKKNAWGNKKKGMRGGGAFLAWILIPVFSELCFLRAKQALSSSYYTFLKFLHNYPRRHGLYHYEN